MAPPGAPLPGHSARRAHLTPTPRRARLLTVLGRPAYRFDGLTVFADTGERLGAVGPAAAAAIASRFTGLPPAAVEYVRINRSGPTWSSGRPRWAACSRSSDSCSVSRSSGGGARAAMLFPAPGLGRGPRTSAGCAGTSGIGFWIGCGRIRRALGWAWSGRPVRAGASREAATPRRRRGRDAQPSRP